MKNLQKKKQKKLPYNTAGLTIFLCYRKMNSNKDKNKNRITAASTKFMTGTAQGKWADKKGTEKIWMN
jgi:hypothetical protein